MHTKIFVFFALNALLSFNHAFAAESDLNKKILDALFVERHLDNIKQTGRVDYFFQGYDRKGDFFEDSLLMNITDINKKNLKSISFKIFSGDRKRTFSDLTHRHQNPVILLFLQRDAENMAELFGDDVQSIRRLVKNAFRKGLRTKSDTVKSGGKKLSCLTSEMQPFLTQNKQIYKDFVNKIYRFTVCPKTPGKVYNIETAVKNEQGVNLFIERLKFVSFTKKAS